MSTNSPGIVRAIGTGDTLQNQCGDIVNATRKAGARARRLECRGQCHPLPSEGAEKQRGDNEDAESIFLRKALPLMSYGSVKLKAVFNQVKIGQTCRFFTIVLL